MQGTRYEQVFSDNFVRADNPDLGAAYDHGYTTFSANLQIVGNKVRSSALTAESLETLNAPTLNNDQWCQVAMPSFHGTGEQNAQLTLRMAAPPTATCYLFAAKRNSSETSSIKRFNAGTGTPLATENATAWADGDVMRVEAQGTTLRLYRNGALLLNAVDAGLTAGRFGLWIYAENSLANVELNAFAAGNILTLSEPPMLTQAVRRAASF